jgi:TPR repeat protein
MAMAEKYLNGTGVPRDGGEAVLWLWRAVGKGNLAATMTLSDLFLRGDILAKNCGQARVLLDAAAKKGSKAAGERLRNLQAFGCE